MPVYRKCTECCNKVLEGTLCKCEQDKKRKNYLDYKRRRLQDKEEKERQKFYGSGAWLRLSENIKRNYLGLCLVCWFKDKIQESEYTHHIETIKDRFDLRLDEENLIPVCDCCHKKIHKQYDKSKNDKAIMQKALKDLIKMFDDEYF